MKKKFGGVKLVLFAIKASLLLVDRIGQSNFMHVIKPTLNVKRQYKQRRKSATNNED